MTGTVTSAPDWNPDLYARFGGERLRPALDLALRITDLRDGAVCDLGCGAGATGPLFRDRFPDRERIGVDTSPAMLEKAAATGAYTTLIEGDAGTWVPEQPLALIYANALLHWLPDHDRLLPHLAGLLAPGGVLAVQMPHQNPAPSHRLWHDLVAHHFPGRFDPATSPGILEPAQYIDILSPLGELDLWETEYYQRLAPAAEGHPVRLFTSSTFARPVLEVLTQAEAADLIAAYDDAVSTVYPLMGDGSVVFPFRRLFFVLRCPAM